MSVLGIGLAGLLLAFAPPVAGTGTVSERLRLAGLSAEDLADWHEGPVRYLLQGAEVDRFRALRTDEQRRQFIRQFWLRRDPDPSSLPNEFRAVFWKRVVEANQMFAASTTPGWRTDRGKIYITMGAPDQVEKDTSPRGYRGVVLPTVVIDPERGSVGSGRETFGDTVRREAGRFGGDPVSESFLGLERWTYRNSPGTGLSPNTVVAFRRDASGDYELSSSPRDVSEFAEMLSDQVGSLVRIDSSLNSPYARSGSNLVTGQFYDLLLQADLGKLGQPPDQDRLLAEIITSEEFFGRLPLRLQADAFLAPAGRMSIAFTIGVPRRVLEHTEGASLNLQVVGRIDRVDGGGTVLWLVGATAPRPAPDNADQDLLLHQAIVELEPGEWRVRFGLFRPDGQEVGSVEERIDVQAPTPGDLTLSSVVLARRLLPLGMAPESPLGLAPFHYGRARVVPRLESRLHLGDELSVYYQIYGARLDPASGAPNLDIAYRFQFLGPDGEYQSLDREVLFEGRSAAVQGWSFPLQDWPPGKYRMEIIVTDRAGRGVANAFVPFTVEVP